MPRRFVISDIHGCSKTFRRLLYDVLKVNKTDEIYLLGDYIDRGPDSKGVIDEILKLKEESYQIRCLRGNHEQLMLDGLRYPETEGVWLYNGGRQMLQSFALRSAKDLPEKYLDFFNRLEYYIQLDDYILVHAGLNCDIPDPFTDQYAMLWIRNFKIDPLKTGYRIVIHGHTPTEMPKIREQLDKADKEFCVGLDNGCVYFGQREQCGTLLCLELNTRKLYSCEYIDF